MADKRAKASQFVNPAMRRQRGIDEDDEYGYQPASGSVQANKDAKDADDLEQQARDLDQSPFGYYGARDRRAAAKSLRASGKLPDTYVKRARASQGSN